MDHGNRKTEIHAKGIVVLRNILTVREQLELIDIVERKGGLKDANGEWNFLGLRGRHFCALAEYEKDEVTIRKYLQRFQEETEKLDNSLK